MRDIIVAVVGKGEVADDVNRDVRQRGARCGGAQG